MRFHDRFLMVVARPYSEFSSFQNPLWIPTHPSDYCLRTSRGQFGRGRSLFFAGGGGVRTAQPQPSRISAWDGLRRTNLFPGG